MQMSFRAVTVQSRRWAQLARYHGVDEFTTATKATTIPSSVTSRAGVIRPRSLTQARYFTSPTSNEFWAELNLAVKNGHGEKAEDIVLGLVKSKSMTPFDTKIFSLALEAWRNSESPHAPRRAHSLLEQMTAFTTEGILRDYPSLDDYHSVLECWMASPCDTTFPAAEPALQIIQQVMQNHTPTIYTFSCVLNILAREGHASSAKEFLQTTVPKPHTVDMYNLVLEAFSRSNQSDAAEQAEAVLEAMQQPNNDLPKPNSTSYDAVLRCWERQASSHPKAPQKALAVLNMMKAQKIQTTLASYQTVINLFAQKGEAIIAEELLNGLVTDYGVQFDAQLKPTIQPFESVLLAYTKCFHNDAAPRAESLLTHIKELYQTGILDCPPDVWSYNYVLKCWMHSNDKQAPNRALYLLEQMKRDGVKPDATTMNTVLNTIARKRDARQAEQFLNKFYQTYLDDPINNPHPDVVSFGTVLKAWSVSTDSHVSAERAEALLLKLQNLHESGWSNCRPDQAIYSSVMKCYSMSKSKDAAHRSEALLRGMQQAAIQEDNPDLKPDVVCWNMAIRAWAQVGNGPRAEALFREMLGEYIHNKATGTAPNNVTFSAVLSAWAKTQNDPSAADRADRLLSEMKRLAQSQDFPDVKPNVISYSIVLDCWAYAKSTAAAERAEKILREMQASNDPNLQPNALSFNAVIKAWSLSRDPRALVKVMHLLKEMIDGLENHGKKQLTPNANTFGSVLKVLAESNAPEKDKRAQIIVGLMEKFGIEWNDWSRRQLRRCNETKEDNIRGGGHRRWKQQRQHTNDHLPGVPDLKYS